MTDTPGRKNAHDYKARLVWDGNLGDGTSTYAGYGRRYRVQFAGKPDLPGSADPIFRGDATLYNPEDLFVASLSSCHLLSYLALCARSRINVVAYEDDASGTLVLRPDGAGKFESVTLRPSVTIAAGSDEKRAMELHETAHDMCFIAASVAVPVRLDAVIKIAHAARSAERPPEMESRP
jgi:organic hydroperoxide reductase OsmC/OhrA